MTPDACDATAVKSADLIYRSAAAGDSCWARNHHGHRRELPMARWMGGPQTTPQDRLADEQVLGHCSSRPTLDLGCGPGRFTASLRQRGIPALGVDSSAAAVEMTRRRGGTAIRRDLFAPLPAEGSWEQILLTDGNIGIGGNPVRILRRPTSSRTAASSSSRSIPRQLRFVTSCCVGKPNGTWGIGFLGRGWGPTLST